MTSADTEARVELLALREGETDAEILSRADEVIRRAHDLVVGLRTQGNRNSAEAVHDLGRLLGASARMRSERPHEPEGDR